MKRLILYFLMLILALSGCGAPREIPMVTAPPATVPATTAAPTTLPTAPSVLNGWQEKDGQRFFYVHDVPLTGWQELDGAWYYFDQSGAMHTGFLDYEGDTYYFHGNGTMARGEVEVDGKTYHFTSSGKRIVVVNPWHHVPEDYTVDLVELDTSISVEGMYVDASCYDALMAMLKECNRVCPYICVVSAYRTQDYQAKLFENKVQRVMAAEKVDQAQARILAAKEVAIPGTSEHQLGLAVDVVDTRCWSLESEQADMPAQQWIMENCWRFGFILRYPADKTEVTGIIYEPWHYRYVGKELAAELYESGLTVEEYLQQLTDGTYAPPAWENFVG